MASDMRSVDFDQVLALLHEWQGRRVKVGVDVTAQPLQVARLAGLLGPAPDIANPYDTDEWEFAVGDGSFALRRDYFTGADFFPGSESLIVTMGEEPTAEGGTPMTLVHVVAQSRADPS